MFASGERVLPKALFNYGLLQNDLGNSAAARAAWQRVLDEFDGETDSEGVLYSRLAQNQINR